MISHILDTDIFSLYIRSHKDIHAKANQYKYGQLALTIINVDETWTGWKLFLNKARSDEERAKAYDRLTESQLQLIRWPMVSYSFDAIQLTAELRKQKLNIGANDLKIAAIALTLNATVVTRNLRDFQRVPNLKIEDWTQ